MKKKFLLICLLFIVLNIAVVGLNLLALGLPEWIFFVFGSLSVLSVLLFFKKGNGRVLSKCLITFIMSLSVIFLFVGTYCNPLWNSVTMRTLPTSLAYDQVISFNEAKSDLEYMMKYVKKVHPSCQHKVKEELQQAYDQAIQDLADCPNITVTMELQQVQRILSTLHDAHTSAYANYNQYHYRKDIASRRQQGDEITKVNGQSLIEILHDKSDHFSYEVESWGINQLKKRLQTLEYLTFLGYDVEQGIVYEYANPSGQTSEVTYYPEDFLTKEEYNAYNHLEQTKESDFVEYSIDPSNSLAILTLRACNYNKEYKECLKNMFREIKEQGITHVAVDLRENGGGNSKVAEEFIRYLDVDQYCTDIETARLGVFNLKMNQRVHKNKKYSDLLFDGDVYVLTSEASFSSAMLFAEYIKDNHLGTIIGETPGNDPNGYGDAACFSLPHSKLIFQVSFSTFRRADREAITQLINPDIPCDRSEAMDQLLECIQAQ